jgi:tRNA threonylcarbamoyladenosine biosynthesis protein TsaB
MARILCLETATTNCSVALSENGSVTALMEDRSADYSHAEKLHTFISELLLNKGVGMHELDAIAVSKGPGSYTGLRIGVSAAKGLCYALDIPLISVPTLESLSLQVSDSDYVIPMLDARRMEVYSAVFNAEKVQIRATKAEILTKGSFSEYLGTGRVTFLGTGVAKFQQHHALPEAHFITDAMPSAREMALLAYKKYKKSDIEDVAYFEPFYLKDFVSG